MADEPVVAAPIVAPVVEAAPAAVVAEAPAVVEAPVAAAEPPPAEVPSLIESMGEQPKVEEAPKAEEAPAEPPKEGELAKVEEVKAEEPAKEEVKPAAASKESEPKVEEKPVEAKPAEPVKPEAVEYAYAIPELITMDDAQKGEFNGALDEFRANPKEGAQKLIDLHVQSLQRFEEQTLRNQVKTFNNTRREWQIAADADPEIGGPAKDTARAAIARVRDAVISTAKPGTPKFNEDKAAFDQFCRVTGAGDNPVMLKMFHRMARFLKEPDPPPPGGKPPASNGANPNATRAQRMYPNTNFGRKAS